MSRRNWALLAALGATTIYGLNHTIAKGVMPTYIRPLGLVLLRVIGAAALFWILSLFVPKGPPLLRSDWWRLLACSFFGMVLNMTAFFSGLELSTPINSSVLVTLTPIIVVLLSALLIREKVQRTRIAGIALGLVGALMLVLYGKETGINAPNIPLGNTLFLVNATSFGLYLILVKKLLERYQPFHLMKWLFTLAVVMNLPLGWTQLAQVSWQTMPLDPVLRIGYVILGTTFLTYLFNTYALTQLKASTVSAFIYVQPLVGIVFALAVGQDRLSPLRVVAGVLVLLGVYLVSKRPTPSP